MNLIYNLDARAPMSVSHMLANLDARAPMSVSHMQAFSNKPATIYLIIVKVLYVSLELLVQVNNVSFEISQCVDP
jgi:hypothetical protein